MLDYVPDGYEFDGYIAAVPGLYGEQRFRFRPMVPADAQALVDQTQGKSAAQVMEILAKACGPRIVRWSLKDPNGNALPLTVENFSRLRPALFDRICNIIQGYKACDYDPEKAVPAQTGTEKLLESEKN